MKLRREYDLACKVCEHLGIDMPTRHDRIEETVKKINANLEEQQYKKRVDDKHLLKTLAAVLNEQSSRPRAWGD